MRERDRRASARSPSPRLVPQGPPTTITTRPAVASILSERKEASSRLDRSVPSSRSNTTQSRGRMRFKSSCPSRSTASAGRAATSGTRSTPTSPAGRIRARYSSAREASLFSLGLPTARTTIFIFTS